MKAFCRVLFRQSVCGDFSLRSRVLNRLPITAQLLVTAGDTLLLFARNDSIYLDAAGCVEMAESIAFLS